MDVLTPEQKFQEFHQANPHVYRELVDLAESAVASGRQRIGFRMLWETMRWNRFVRTTSDDDYKLNNNWHKHYVQLIIQNEPHLADVFEVRNRGGVRSEVARVVV